MSTNCKSLLVKLKTEGGSSILYLITLGWRYYWQVLAWLVSVGGYQFALWEITFSVAISLFVILENMDVFGDGVFLLVLVFIIFLPEDTFFIGRFYLRLLALIVVNLLKELFLHCRGRRCVGPEDFTFW